MNDPRTMSSSVRRAQSPASRWVRNVLTVIGQPALRMIAFHLPDGVFTRVAIGVSRECVCSLFVPALYLKLYPNSNRYHSIIENYRDSAESLELRLLYSFY